MSDGLGTDAAGRLYATLGEQNAIGRRMPAGSWETVVRGLAAAVAGHDVRRRRRPPYVTANQLYRQPKYRRGKDERRKPYVLFRTPLDAGPVELRR